LTWPLETKASCPQNVVVDVTARRLRLEPGHRYPRHAHHAWAFGLVGTGSVRLWRAGAWHPTGRTDATVLHPGEVHGGVIDPHDGMSYVTVTVSAGLVADVLGHGRHPRFADLRQPAGPVRRLVRSARATAPEEQSERTVAALAALFGQAADGTTPALPPRSGMRLAIAVRRQLDAAFTGQVRISAVARDLGVAPATVIRQFSRQYGLPPYAYVISRRVDLARQLLDAGAPPAGAAARAGFYDQAHLNRHFRPVVGVTPDAYRRG
jgi:AraC-like DNA-binding protein